MNKEKNFVSAVIYVRNAQNRLAKFLSTMIDTLEGNFEHSEIICVNDSSEDDSLSVIREQAGYATSTSISVINLSFFHGLELSMHAGIDLSIGDFVFEFDNTVMDYDSNLIMSVYARSLQGYDIVSASPRKKQKFTSRLFYRTFDHFSNGAYHMSTESFRILSRRVINRIGAMNKTVPYRKAIYATSGLKTDTIAYDIKPGMSDVSIDKKERKFRETLAIDSLILFTDLGYKLSIWMTLIMMLVAAIMLVYSVITYSVSHPVPGWTTTILFLSFSFFGLFAILTIIIKHLNLLLNLVFKRKNYTFESIEKLTK